jgi:CarD family transcriptional regulator
MPRFLGLETPLSDESGSAQKGSIMDIASVVRSLYHRSKIKELPILERKLYDSAINLLQDEISYSLGKPKEEIVQLILARLER